MFQIFDGFPTVFARWVIFPFDYELASSIPFSVMQDGLNLSFRFFVIRIGAGVILARHGNHSSSFSLFFFYFLFLLFLNHMHLFKVQRQPSSVSSTHPAIEISTP